MRQKPLYRALRADKLTYAALEATLEAYQRSTQARDVPVLRMLSATRAEIENRARAFAEALRARTTSDALRIEIIAGKSVVGGGSAPTIHPPTALVVLAHESLSVSALEETLRRARAPVIARILEGRVAIDLRTVSEDEEPELLDAVSSACSP